jgi:hypothetical protein
MNFSSWRSGGFRSPALVRQPSIFFLTATTGISYNNGLVRREYDSLRGFSLTAATGRLVIIKNWFLAFKKIFHPFL